MSQRVIQREGRWKSLESSKVYTRNNPEDAGTVSRKLAETGKIGQRQPGQGTVLGRTPYVVSTRPRGWGLSMVCYHWGSRSPETACVSALASLLRGGAPGFWQYDRRREAAAGAAALVSRQWKPPAHAENNMTIRRIYNTAIYFFEMSVLFETGELNTYVDDSGGLYRRKHV